MSLVNRIESKVRDYLDGDYQIIETRNIPSVNNVSIGKRAYKMKLCTFCIDLRESTDLLFSHQKQTAGKIHKSFLAVVSEVVLNNGGKIRSFQGDSLLAFWSGHEKTEISKSVEAAMTIKWLLNTKLTKYFEKYKKLDFGIGIDTSEVYILKAGITGNYHNNDLVFIGKGVNFAVAIADQAEGPYHIEISNAVYELLVDDWKFGKNRNGENENMWEEGEIKWQDKLIKTKITKWHCIIS